MQNTIQKLSDEEILYDHNCGKKSFQWELWQECNTACAFCVLGCGYKKTSKERKLKSLIDLKDAIKGIDFDVYNNISLMGGEFFQGQLNDPEIKEKFLEIIRMCRDLYLDKKIGSIWITATLNLGDQSDLYEVLQVFEDGGFRPNPNFVKSGLWICTSWDKEGRFRTKGRKDNWEFHMLKMKREFPWVKLNTSMILTQGLCEDYLQGKFVPKKFMEKFDTQLVLNVPRIFDVDRDGFQSLVANRKTEDAGKLDAMVEEFKVRIEKDLGFRFFPDRKTFRKFLVKFARDDADLFDISLFNIERTADETIKNYNDIENSVVNRRNKGSNIEACSVADVLPNKHCLITDLDKKHSIAYQGYIDSNACMLCDREQVRKSLRLKS